MKASYRINTEIFKLNIGESHDRCILMYELYWCMDMLMDHMKFFAFIWKLSSSLQSSKRTILFIIVFKIYHISEHVMFRIFNR